MKLPRPILALTALCGLAQPALCQNVALTKARQPNIIFVLADDMGWGDYGVFWQNQRAKTKTPGEPWHATPNLDVMAAQGVALPDHYCPAPVCAPSRASLLSGVTQGHSNVRNNQFDKALEDNHTLASVLKGAGYATAAFGKWGLQGAQTGAGDWVAHPEKRGFDYYYGYIAHKDGHFHYPKEDGRPVWDDHTDVAAGLDKCYTSDLFTARAEKWIADQHQNAPDKPFFAYLALDTPHAKLQLPPAPFPAEGLKWLGQPGQMINAATGTVDSYVHPDYANAVWDDDRNAATPDVPWPDIDKRHATAVRRIDDCVGDLMKKLVALGIDEDTLVIFSSDNGPADESYLPEQYTPNFFNSFGPFDGIKRDVFEGGVRVGAIAHWPARIGAGRFSKAPSSFSDWMATFADIAHVPTPARSDGVSLLPSLTGTGTQKPSPIYIEYWNSQKTPDYPEFVPAHRARERHDMQFLRIGDMVGLRTDIQSHADDFEIYNIVKDPQEKNNLAAQLPQLQRRFKDLALQSRRPTIDDPKTARPYDDELVPAVQGVGAKAGVFLTAYDGRFAYVPDATSMRAPIGGPTNNANRSMVPRPQTGAVLYQGFIQAPADGEYTFYLTSAGRAFLRLHRAQLIDADYGYQSGSEVTAKIRLQKGKHPFRLTEANTGGQGMRTTLQWSGPGFGKQMMPDSAFSYD